MTTLTRASPTEPEPGTGADMAGMAGRYQSDHHDTRNAAWLGLALGVTFTVSFATGLLSHLIQHPFAGFEWLARPAGLYRVTQGLHIATGTAAIPLLVAKLWVVAPQFWGKPVVRNFAHGVERAMLFPLVGGSAFLLVTGTFNTFHFYPWGFFFPTGHYWAAWITIGGLVGHIGAKAGVTWAALRHGDPSKGELAGQASHGSRRWFLSSVAVGSGALTVATVGQTWRPLRSLSVLAPRDPIAGPQGIPVNRSASSAGITKAKVGDAWRLRVHGRGLDQPMEMTLADLRGLPQHHATLPISCVEGWSASATWRGVRVRDLLDHVGAPPGATVRVGSIQKGSRYRQSDLNRAQAGDPDTLLALELNGETLALDHGFPIRLIGPNRPGVQQTKWLNEVEVT